MMPVRRAQGWLPGILDDFFGDEWVDKTSSTAPAVNVVETDKDYKVEIAAPGLKRDDFKIDINEDNELIVSMEKRSESENNNSDEGAGDNDKTAENKPKKHTYLRREFSYGSFRQRMILPDNVNVENITARMDNGVLTIDIPKKTEEEKRKSMRSIEIA